MRSTNILLFFLFLSYQFSAQDYKIKYATELSAENKYAEALPVWEELAQVALKNKSNEVHILGRAIEASYLTENYRKTVYWFTKISPYLAKEKLNSTEQLWRYYIQALKFIGFEKRVPGAIDSAITANPESPFITELKNNLALYFDNMARKSEYVVRAYRNQSKGEEFGAFPYKKGILFVSNEFNHNAVNKSYPRTGQFYSDIAFYDSLENLKKFKITEKPFWLEFLYKNRWRNIDRSQAHDGPISFNPQKNMAFLTCNFSEKDKTDTVKYKRLQQRVFSVSGDVYTEIVFPFNSPQFNTGHASMDSEGNMYFVSDRPGSVVEGYEWNAKTKKMDTLYSADIWKTTYKDGSWSAPERLGEDINTPGDELFPFISDWGVLYFSSNAWGSMGGLDIFSSDLNGKRPENIGAPLNSNADDFAYYVNEDEGKGYFSTNREGLKDKIYAFNKPIFKADLLVTLVDCKKKPLNNATIVVTDLATGDVSELTTAVNGQTEPIALKRNRNYKILYAGTELITSDSAMYKAIEPISKNITLYADFRSYISKITILDSVSKPLANAVLKIYKKNGITLSVNTNKFGSYSWRNEGDSRIDSIQATAINYDDAVFQMPSADNGNCIDTVFYTLRLKTISEEKFIRLDMVLYNFDQYSLRPEGEAELDKLVAYMNAHPKYRVELSSHTDSRGSDEYNMRLSKNRAKSCVNYILSKGIDKKLITAEGFGETKLVNNCANDVPCSEEEHQANRRTELKLFTSEEEVLDNNKLKDK